jgi:hypothetical protein
VKPQLVEALAQAGITEDDYRQIQKAQQIVDRVNARLAQRGALLMYAVMTVSAQSARTTWPSEIREN